MTTGSTVEVHHLFEGPEEAPVLVLSNTPGTTLGMWDEQAPRWAKATASCATTTAACASPGSEAEYMKGVKDEGV
jgi:hypothetical protein